MEYSIRILELKFGIDNKLFKGYNWKRKQNGDDVNTWI